MVLTPLMIGDARFRAGRWQGRAEVALLVPLSTAQTLDQQSLSTARRILRNQGFTEVVTAALAPAERAAFERDDFSERESLHLLCYDLTNGSDAEPDSPRTGGQPYFQHLRSWHPTRPRIRRGTSRDLHGILALDGQSFDEFWHFNQSGLEDSMTATPSSRLRVVRRFDLAEPLDSSDQSNSGHSNRVVGYALAGRSGRAGYLQRLAVHPAARQQGIGTLLVNDALAWARRHGAELVWVNTQKHNNNALRLYQKLGFALREHPLTVMCRTLT